MEEDQTLSQHILQKVIAKVGTITKVEHLKKGLTNTLFLLENKAKKQFIVKVFSNIQGLLPHREQEVYLNNLLWQQGLTSKLLLYNNEFFLFDYIQGQNLTAKMLNQDTLKQINVIVTTINSTDLESYNFFKRDFLETAKAYVQPLTEELKNSQVVSSTLQLLEKTLICIGKEFPKELALCHNDYNLNNLLLDVRGKLLVIDFEYAAINDIYFEYAGLQFMLGERLQTFIELQQKPINIEKLKKYSIILDCLSILWCYLMFVQAKVIPKPNYLAFAKKVHTNLFSK